MAEIWKPQSIEIYKEWINTILDEASDELNAWEANFIADIELRLENKRSLTQGQAEVLERIYTEKTK